MYFPVRYLMSVSVQKAVSIHDSNIMQLLSYHRVPQSVGARYEGLRAYFGRLRLSYMELLQEIDMATLIQVQNEMQRVHED